MQSNQSKLQLKNLFDVLSEQLGIYCQLLDLVQKERAAVTASKLDGLNDVITEKTYLVHLLNEIENRRIKLMADIAIDFHLDPGHCTLKSLANCADQKSAEKLLQLRTDLSSILKKLQSENNTNKKLMTHCVTLMDSSINMLNGINFQETTYVQTGQTTHTQGNGVLFTGKI